jgi:hypothetical protein
VYITNRDWDTIHSSLGLVNSSGTGSGADLERALAVFELVYDMYDRNTEWTRVSKLERSGVTRSRQLGKGVSPLPISMLVPFVCNAM